MTLMILAGLIGTTILSAAADDPKQNPPPKPSPSPDTATGENLYQQRCAATGDSVVNGLDVS